MADEVVQPELVDDDLDWVLLPDAPEPTRRRRSRRQRMLAEQARWMGYYERHGMHELAMECARNMGRLEKGEVLDGLAGGV